MTNDRKKERITFWGPRALAVLSCALALLVAQPVMGAGDAGGSKPVLLREMGTLGGVVLPEAGASKATESKFATARPVSFLASARRLHILATVEIFQRLLIAELRGPGSAGGGQVVPALCCFEPVCVAVLPPASEAVTGVRALPVLLQPVAQAFAIAHCLLAPPVV